MFPPAEKKKASRKKVAAIKAAKLRGRQSMPPGTGNDENLPPWLAKKKMAKKGRHVQVARKKRRR